MSLRVKAKKDLVIIMNFIKNHDNANDIYSLFIKGPDPKCGFMWTTPNEWWAQEQLVGYKAIENKVLDLGWDSSGYGMMMRMIESKIKDMFQIENPSIEERRQDDGKAFAQAYQKTDIAKSMDESNKKALDVMAKKGSDEAVKHMMNMAGGDYARMRMDFG